MGITADTGEIIYAIADSLSNWTWHNTGYFVTAGEWTHVAVTFDGIVGEINTYINGSLVNTFTQPGPIGDVYPIYDDLTIGGRENATDQRFQGLIDEVRIWSATRSQGEIQSTMTGLLTGAEAGLAGNWRLDEGSTGVVADQSANGNNGTLGGAEGTSATPTYQGYYTDEDTLLTIPAGSGVLANDFDDDGDALSVTNLDTTGMIGTLVLNLADGSFTYDPSGAFESLRAGEHVIETFTYTANDGSDDSNTVTVTITVTGVNDAPVVVADNFTVNEGSTTNLNLATNDSDADDGLDLTSLAIVSGPANGSITVNADGTVDYTHNGSETAADSFTYTITDQAGVTSTTVTVSMTITPQNDAPTVANIIPDQVATEDSAFTFTFAANTFSDVDAGDSLTYTASGLPSWLSFDPATRTFTGTPTNADVGTVTVTVRATDGSAVFVEDQFDITVVNVNNAPVIAGANTGAVTKNVDPDADGLLEVNGALTISDPDTGESSFQAGTVVGAYGSLTIDAAGNWNYAADNSQAAIQQLNTGESISDVLTVTTADGTTHSIIVIINGATTIVDQGGDDSEPGPGDDPIEPDPEPEPEFAPKME